MLLSDKIKIIILNIKTIAKYRTRYDDSYNNSNSKDNLLV